MKTSIEPPTELTRHGVKQICESKNVAKEFKGVNMAFQVVSVDLFDPKDEGSAKKNLKGRIRLSDGVSKIMVMLSGKAYDAIIESGEPLEKWSIWSLNVSKQTI